jgi:hypothetical protein
MNKGVEKMYKRDDYYYSRIQPVLLMKEMDENYRAETELVTINRLEESPKNETVRAYMKMNDKLKEGMVA